jgi:cytochrome c oxidase cbb3-type subunit 4
MSLVEIQAYAYVFLTALLVFLLYGYIFHLYRSQKNGIRDYEKYGNIALDDELISKPIEEREEKSDRK